MKIIKKITAMMLAMLLMLAVIPSAGAASISVNANSALLIEMNTGQVLYENNADAQVDQNELVKFMTILLVAEAVESGNAKLDDTVTVTEQAFEGLAEGGGSATLAEGEEMSLENLMYCLYLSSMPEAANMVAIHIAGSVSSFVDMMNSRAAELGCTGTYFSTPHGKGESVQYTTANDMKLIINEGFRHQDFRRLFMTSSRIVDATNVFGPRNLYTTNSLMIQDSGYFYENCTGGLMANSTESNYCMAASAESTSLSLMGIVFGAGTEKDEEDNTTYLVFTEMKRMFEWGVANYSYRELVSAGEKITNVPVQFGNDADSVDVAAAETISILLDNDVQLSTFRREILLYHEQEGRNLVAPISTNEVLGEVSVYKDGKLYGKVKLVATANIELQRLQYLRLRIKETLSYGKVKLAIVGVVLMFILYFAYVIFYSVRKKKIPYSERGIKKSSLKERLAWVAAREHGVENPSDGDTHRMPSEPLAGNDADMPTEAPKHSIKEVVKLGARKFTSKINHNGRSDEPDDFGGHDNGNE